MSIEAFMCFFLKKKSAKDSGSIGANMVAICSHLH